MFSFSRFKVSGILRSAKLHLGKTSKKKKKRLAGGKALSRAFGKLKSVE
jgi:hypothetical protein